MTCSQSGSRFAVLGPLDADWSEVDIVSGFIYPFDEDRPDFLLILELLTWLLDVSRFFLNEANNFYSSLLLLLTVNLSVLSVLRLDGDLAF